MAVAYAKVCITLCGGFQFKTKKGKRFCFNSDCSKIESLNHDTILSLRDVFLGCLSAR